MEKFRALEKHTFFFGNVLVGNTAIHRANRGALFLIEESYALRALLRNDVVDVVRDGIAGFSTRSLPFHTALIDRGVRALRFARAAVDALFRNLRRHPDLSRFGNYRQL
jgi:hypothetical protein